MDSDYTATEVAKPEEKNYPLLLLICFASALIVTALAIWASCALWGM